MPDMGEDVMIITDAILDAATVAFKANGFDLRAVLEAAIGAMPVVPAVPRTDVYLASLFAKTEGGA